MLLGLFRANPRVRSAALDRMDQHSARSGTRTPANPVRVSPCSRKGPAQHADGERWRASVMLCPGQFASDCDHVVTTVASHCRQHLA